MLVICVALLKGWRV